MDVSLWRSSTTSALHVVQSHRIAVVRVNTANLDNRIWPLKKGCINKLSLPVIGCRQGQCGCMIVGDNAVVLGGVIKANYHYAPLKLLGGGI